MTLSAVVALETFVFGHCEELSRVSRWEGNIWRAWVKVQKTYKNDGVCGSVEDLGDGLAGLVDELGAGEADKHVRPGLCLVLIFTLLGLDDFGDGAEGA